MSSSVARPHDITPTSPVEGAPDAGGPAGTPGSRRRAGRRTGRRGFRWHHLIPILLVLAGVGILLYPVAATQYNNVKQQQFADAYNQSVQQAAPDQLATLLDAARAYNARINGVPILDPYLGKAAGDPGSAQWRDYAGQLAAFDAMARLRVPTADINLPVYHSTSDEVLAKGAGHLYGTSLPVGGPSTHAVLTSHTGLSNATLFDHLTRVKQGDYIFVDVAGQTLAYRVDQIKVVLPTEIGDLTKVDGHDYVTLFTCTPYAVNTHRLLVRGERVDYTPDVAAQSTSSQRASFRLEPWMVWMIAGAGGGLVALLAVLLLDRLTRRRRGGGLVAATRRRDEEREVAEGSAARDEERAAGDVGRGGPQSGSGDDSGAEPAGGRPTR